MVVLDNNFCEEIKIAPRGILEGLVVANYP
jgi:hypothetical protein